jgi:hypothetical protein
MTKRHGREIAFLILLVFSLCLAFYPVLFGVINHIHGASGAELQLGQ